jgi:hypothetical protein
VERQHCIGAKEKGATMNGLERERERLVALRDAAERQHVAASNIHYEALLARRLAARKYNNACMSVYDFDVAQSSD